ncbi:MAG: hypothetical protein KF778_15780 [Rhodocyclaceae bacterium]|nr:hypothetical protein [Rhodocyclaceae bacterium]MBX3669862.1 hypothetical protein [Rhodocyclaceae bacterium]
MPRPLLRIIALLLHAICIASCLPAAAAVLNVEFNFTPYTGDAAKSDQLESVPGKATIYVNNLPFAEQEIQKQSILVMFDDRQISPAVWITGSGLGGALRKGKNRLRIEFEPTDPKLAYRAHLRWSSVTDQVTRTENGPGRGSETNMADQGKEDKPAKGRVVLEREFMADFATERPWHKYPPVTQLSDADRQTLMQMVSERAASFKPDFSAVYSQLAGVENLRVDEVKKLKCLDKAYAAGVRIKVAAADQVDIVVTGNPEVVVQAKTGQLFGPTDPRSFERIKDSKVQMCAGFTLAALYPQRMLVVRTPAGKWEVVR